MCEKEFKAMDNYWLSKVHPYHAQKLDGFKVTDQPKTGA